MRLARLAVLAILTLAWGLLAAPLVAEAQPARRPVRVGSRSFTSPPPPGTPPGVFTGALKDLGWAQDRDVVLEVRYAAGDPERLPVLARELVELPVDVLVTGGTAATRAATMVTRTIPIVFIGVGDPVATGLVASLARPGGNVTGIATQHPDSERKRLEVLRELVPGAREVVFIYNPNNPSSLLACQGSRGRCDTAPAAPPLTPYSGYRRVGADPAGPATPAPERNPSRD